MYHLGDGSFADIVTLQQWMKITEDDYLTIRTVATE